MRFLETKDYDEMSETAAKLFADCLKNKPDALFCLATGSSPTKAYEYFSKKVGAGEISTDKMRVVKLDEWRNLEKNNPATCEYYLRKHILSPCNISDDRYISFDTRAKDDIKECRRIVETIADNGGIDCAVLGIGKNGHLGLNEPKEAIEPFAHVAQLDTKTKEHSMLKDNNVTAVCGYTLGIKDILASKKIILLITGTGKLEAYERLKKPTISSMAPANYLWLHDDVVCVVDRGLG